MRPTARVRRPRIFSTSSTVPPGRRSASSSIGFRPTFRGMPHGLARFDGTAPLRTRRSAQGRTPGLGYAHLQLRPQRSARLSHFQRAVLVEAVSHRRTASGCGGLDALPRLFAQPGEWIPNRYGGRENLEAIELSAALQRTRPRGPGRRHHCRGVHLLPRRLRPGLPGRTGLHHEMEHGLDARHARLLLRKIRSTASTTTTTSRSACSTPSRRTSSCPSRTTKWCTASVACSARCPATTGSSSPTSRAFLGYMYGHPGKKLLFMGSEIGQYEEWNQESSVRWELLHYDYHRKLTDTRARVEPTSIEPNRRSTGGLQLRRASSGSTSADAEKSTIAFLRRAEDPDDFLVFSATSPGAAIPLPRRCPAAGRTTRRSSTATPPCSEAATWATRAAFSPRPCPSTNARTASPSPCLPWASWCSGNAEAKEKARGGRPEPHETDQPPPRSVRWFSPVCHLARGNCHSRQSGFTTAAITRTGPIRPDSRNGESL